MKTDKLTMKSSFLFFLFVASTALANTPCGKEGSIEDRIKECNFTKDHFVLVARDDKGNEFYKDTKSGLIWSDRLAVEYNHYGSQKACGSEAMELQILKDLKWRLPSINEFETAASHGMKDVLSRMNHWFWTSTPVKRKRVSRRRAPPAQSYIWDGVGQKSDAGDLKDAASIRCVAR